MQKLKPHLSVDQIAKKHRLDVSFVQKQLDMGEPIEHEHTKDHKLAMYIALQHLDEIPDYYTRLKKMESDAKNHHKKFKDINVNEEGLRDWFGKSKSKDGKKGWVDVVDGDACAREKGETSTPKCVSSEKRASMSREERLAAQAAKRREDPNQPQKSGAAKPTMVKTDRKIRKEEMDLQEVKDKPGKGSGKKDACYHKVKSRYDVWPSAYASGALVKCRKVGASNWGTKSEESDFDIDTNNNWDIPLSIKPEPRYCPKCKEVQLRSECKYGSKYWDTYSVPKKLATTSNYQVEEKDHEKSMIRSELSIIDSAVKRLRKKMKGEGNIEAWIQSKITKASDYLDTAADYIDSGEHKIKENKIVDEMKCWPGYKKKGTQELFGKKYNRCVKSEDTTIEDLNGNTFAEVIDLIKPEPIKGFKSQIEEATRLQSQTGNVMFVVLSWRGKYYSLRMFFPQIKTPTKKEISNELQKVYPGSIVISYSVSEIQPGQPLIQFGHGYQGGSSASLGPSKNYVKTMGEEIEIEEDWQKVNRQDKTDGLSQAAVNAYRRENPGSKLQTAVTEKKPTGKRAKRRASFCRRMKGMKSKLTSAKTARDPDSRINKALRRWNCN